MATEEVDTLSRKHPHRVIEPYDHVQRLPANKHIEDPNRFAERAISSIKKKALDHLNKMGASVSWKYVSMHAETLYLLL